MQGRPTVSEPIRIRALVHRLNLWVHSRWGKYVLQGTAFVCTFALVLVGMAFAVSGAVCIKTADRIVTVEDLANMEGEFDYVIVLGCKVHDGGRLSDRLADRVSVGISVFESGIAETLLMSGDRQDDGSYDEVGAMQDTAVAAGILKSDVEIDPRGYSTYESILRLCKVYQARRVVIVTQEYHLYRALYIAEKMGLDAYGVSADLRPYSDQFKCEVREIAARVKDVWYVQTKQDAVSTK